VSQQGTKQRVGIDTLGCKTNGFEGQNIYVRSREEREQVIQTDLTTVSECPYFEAALSSLSSLE
jgi:hypothetical protein